MKDKAMLMRLAGRVFNTPLMIHPAKLDVILGVIGNRIGMDTPDIPKINGQEDWGMDFEREEPENQGRIAVIPVYGTLVHHTGGLDAMSGLRSYESIRADFKTALHNSEFDDIVFDYCTYGGEVSGAFDLADEIYEARGIKRIHAIINEQAYSAGYLLASSAEKIYVPRTAGAGSIGVIAKHMDQSGWDEQQGLKFTSIFAGKHKNDFSPHEPLNSHAIDTLQVNVNETRDLFADTIARNRDMSAQVIKDMEAGVFKGEHIVEAGLADQVMSWEQALDHIITTNSKQGGQTMNQAELQSALEALITTPGVDAAAALATMGYVPAPDASAAIDIDKLQAEAREAGEQAVMDRVKGVLDACALGDRMDMASNLINEGLSVEDAQKKIIDANAESSGQNEITSTVGAVSTGGINPLVADAEQRAGNSAV